jgi:hypothetical protein
VAHVAQEKEGLSTTLQRLLPDLGLERCEANNSPSEKVYADQKEDGSNHLTAVSPQETDDRVEVLVEVARRDEVHRDWHPNPAQRDDERMSGLDDDKTTKPIP